MREATSGRQDKFKEHIHVILLEQRSESQSERTVSYTHLDVYKRQLYEFWKNSLLPEKMFWNPSFFPFLKFWSFCNLTSEELPAALVIVWCSNLLYGLLYERIVSSIPCVENRTDAVVDNALPKFAN